MYVKTLNYFSVDKFTVMPVSMQKYSKAICGSSMKQKTKIYAHLIRQNCKRQHRSLAHYNWWLRSSLEERLTANVKVVTVLVSIPASSDTMETVGRQMKQC